MDIIFLNGTSSSGKSSIAKILMSLLDRPFIHTGIDRFFDMMPNDYVHFGPHNKQGFGFTNSKDRRGPIVEINNGPMGDRFYRSIVQCSKVMADAGQNLIIDEVLFEDSYLIDYVKALKGHRVYFVAVFCSLEIIEEREFLRGNRIRFIARPQLKRVHGPTRIYDFTVDTSQAPAFACAREIIDLLNKQPNPVAFNRLYKLFTEQDTQNI